MPIYQFKDEAAGEVLESFFEYGDAPSIGEYTVLCGRRVRRLPSRMSKPTVRNWDVIGVSLEPWAPGAEGYTDEKSPYGPGVPCFSSEASVNAFCDETARRSEKDACTDRMTFDRDWGAQWQDKVAQKRGGPASSVG